MTRRCLLERKGTVAWAVDRLDASFFRNDPTGLITVWLFKDKASYERNC